MIRNSRSSYWTIYLFNEKSEVISFILPNKIFWLLFEPRKGLIKRPKSFPGQGKRLSGTRGFKMASACGPGNFSSANHFAWFNCSARSSKKNRHSCISQAIFYWSFSLPLSCLHLWSQSLSGKQQVLTGTSSSLLYSSYFCCHLVSCSKLKLQS